MLPSFRRKEKKGGINLAMEQSKVSYSLDLNTEEDWREGGGGGLFTGRHRIRRIRFYLNLVS